MKFQLSKDVTWNTKYLRIESKAKVYEAVEQSKLRITETEHTAILKLTARLLD